MSEVTSSVSTKCSDRWTPVNIAGVVAGFVFMGPFGLLVLFWVLSGRDISQIPTAMRGAYHWVRGMKNGKDWSFNLAEHQTTDNVVFNEYQQTQVDRIKEIREDMNRRRAQFEAFRANVKRRADEDEFRRFMHEAPLRSE
jgi:hypothetical protein